MTDRSTFPRSGRRALIGAFVVGSLFAAIGGIGVSHSNDARPNLPAAAASVRTEFDPRSALLGLVIGAPLGGLAGTLWGRRGMVGAAGFILVTFAGGLVGMVAAAWFGARTLVAVNGNTFYVEHGAPTPVLVGGAILGLVLGALGAWWLGYRTSQQVPAESGAAPAT